ncbi:type IV pilus modification PilV family protein [Sulfuriferula thiophila]|uniref:type IV pilus modification PilV family protein n=1 Tax=Sulfuriferula thiophila TaxID=1781211 RepID=UPI000F60C393|nr:prepilin-type N-terminal cleavage/methylation domain-containing protein [Sulfuriferula thiophila]
MCTIKRQSGVSLIELIIFIVIVSTAVAGVLAVMNVTTQHSADPMLRKQAQAIAESLLEEIELQPFTTCDPNDATASTGTCTTTPEAMGPDVNPDTGVTETRYDSANQFDNVNDYAGFTMTGINDITNTPIGGLGSYTATVAIATDGASFGLASGQVLKIDVTVTRGNDSLTLTGYRFQYAPNAVP